MIIGKRPFAKGRDSDAKSSKSTGHQGANEFYKAWQIKAARTPRRRTPFAAN
jgi:hypothetical protein